MLNAQSTDLPCHCCCCCLCLMLHCHLRRSRCDSGAGGRNTYKEDEINARHDVIHASRFYHLECNGPAFGCAACKHPPGSIPSPDRFIADAYFKYACNNAAAAGTDAWPGWLGTPGLAPAAAAAAPTPLAPCRPESPEIPEPAGEDSEASEASEASAGKEPAPAC